MLELLSMLRPTDRRCRLGTERGDNEWRSDTSDLQGVDAATSCVLYLYTCTVYRVGHEQQREDKVMGRSGASQFVYQGAVFIYLKIKIDFNEEK